MSIDIEHKTTEVSNTTTVLATAGQAHAHTYENKDIEVTARKNEFLVVSDGIYASVSDGPPPPWLVEILDELTNNILSPYSDAITQANRNILDALSEIEVAKNTYQEMLSFSETVDGIVNSRLQTLNATLGDITADIRRLETTSVTPTQATAMVADLIAASLGEGGAIGGRIGSVSSVVANIQGVVLSNYNEMVGEFEALRDDLEITANALVEEYTNIILNEREARIEAVDHLRTEFTGGLNEAVVEINNTITLLSNDHEALASDVSNLSAAFINEQERAINAETTLANEVKATKDYAASLFQYDSKLTIDGKVHYSGFGLKSSLHSAGSGTASDPYRSEFWVNADAFKFYSQSHNKTINPFTITTQGNIPRIVIKDAALVSNNYTGATLGNISGTPNGFRLSATAAGTDNDPNIYGAYIRGATIKAGNFQINSLNFWKPSGNTAEFRLGSSSEYIQFDGSTLKIVANTETVRTKLATKKGQGSGEYTYYSLRFPYKEFTSVNGILSHYQSNAGISPIETFVVDTGILVDNNATLQTKYEFDVKLETQNPDIRLMDHSILKLKSYDEEAEVFAIATQTAYKSNGTVSNTLMARVVIYVFLSSNIAGTRALMRIKVPKVTVTAYRV